MNTLNANKQNNYLTNEYSNIILAGLIDFLAYKTLVIIRV